MNEENEENEEEKEFFIQKIIEFYNFFDFLKKITLIIFEENIKMVQMYFVDKVKIVLFLNTKDHLVKIIIKL